MASRGRWLTRPGGAPDDWGSRNWALGSGTERIQSGSPAAHALPSAPLGPSRPPSAPRSYPNLPLGGADEWQPGTAAIHVPGAKMAT